MDAPTPVKLTIIDEINEDLKNKYSEIIKKHLDDREYV